MNKSPSILPSILKSYKTGAYINNWIIKTIFTTNSIFATKQPQFTNEKVKVYLKLINLVHVSPLYRSLYIYDREIYFLHHHIC